MTTIPENLKYTKDHEWIKVDGEIATIGITDYAQNALGDIVFVELPDSGEQVELGDASTPLDRPSLEATMASGGSLSVR